MSIVDRAKNIVVTPKTEWNVVAGETPNVQQILVGYILPLALIPAVASIVGGMLFPGLFSTSFHIASAIVALLTSVLGVFLTAYVIDLLAPQFGSEKDFGRSLQVVAYANTPAWLAGILNLFPALSVLVVIASLYGVYLLYLGLPVVKKTPADKVVVYLVVTVVVLIVIYLVIGAILGSVLLGIFGFGAVTSGMMGR